MPDFEESTSGDFILLGGQISNKHKEFQVIAQLDPKSALFIGLLDKIKDGKERSTIDWAQELVMLKGQINFMAQCGELTKLSAIMGDTRKNYSSKGLNDVLRNVRLGRYSNNTAAASP